MLRSPALCPPAHATFPHPLLASCLVAPLLLQHCGVDPADVDILMGTFTKSFGGMGGYIASSKAFVEQLKRQTSGSMLSTAMSPIICKQIIRAFDIIDGETESGRWKNTH